MSGKIYLTSDLHFGHDREFIWKARGFNSIHEMNEAYVKRWNETIDMDDDVYILGDLMLGAPENISYIKQLQGRIHVVLGNHDTNARQAAYNECYNIVEVEWAIMLTYNKYHFFLTHFPCLTGNLEHEHLRQMTLNLFGHTHQTTDFYEDRPYMYHVGVDSHDGYPVLIDDIIEEMRRKVDECKELLQEEVQYAEQATSSNVYNEKSYKLNLKTEDRCDKCVHNIATCGHYLDPAPCPMYKRDPPDGGFYG